MRVVLYFLALSCSSVSAQTCEDHGVPINGFPNWQERSMLVMTNAARISPVDYKNFYLAPGGVDLSLVLQPSVYPSRPPLQYSYQLSQSARFHSNELATVANCPLQHNSCDGTVWATRIAHYYPSWSLLGENIAAGFGDPITSVGGLIADPHNGAPAPDGSGYDGHRWNIMYPNYFEVGIGYASGPNPYRIYWTQDFGRPKNVPAVCSPIASASHTFLFGEVFFLANFYDQNNLSPRSANLVLEGILFL